MKPENFSIKISKNWTETKFVGTSFKQKPKKKDISVLTFNDFIQKFDVYANAVIFIQPVMGSLFFRRCADGRGT